ncbi:sensor histidine kinase [Plantactinospora soyae]|uniref:histidine kinase n=1 Tax=Plantactinospora soyae TaxID=1544732 RepID=A0A927M4A5_9ACTN|nr:sensor histidine kinase [Plantactinospora soyae]MBE1486396.1 signal transduction histidine kinase [Plantactinospora soyae]
MARWNLDSLAAVAVAAGVIAGTQFGPRADEQIPLDLAGYALLVAGSLPLVWRRRRPLLVAALTAVACVAYYGLLYPGIFAATPVLLAVYTLISLGHRGQGIAAALAYATGFYLAITVARADFEIHDGLLWQIGFLIAVGVIGQMVASHRAYLRAVEERAIQAERTRDEAALRRAGEERLWIAQELHDTLTHSIAVINVQVGVAVHLLSKNPEQARSALTAIKETGQEAMRELRSTLGVLRHVDPDGAEAGLATLPKLVARAEAAGLPVTLAVRGDVLPLTAEADRAAYRIVQEALTNVLRHAGHPAVTVTREYHRDTVTLRVENDGEPLRSEPRHGMGLIGMRERAVAAGGSLSTGTRPGGGFRVEAELPLGHP